MTILATSAKPAAETQNIAALAAEAMTREVTLTPKPGLVDSLNNGAHCDMDIALFHASIAAVAPWFPLFYARGYATAGAPASRTLQAIRPTGLACEQAMFSATGGVNTHKGGIFSLGLLCAAAGRLAKSDKRFSQESLCFEIHTMCAGLVDGELEKGGRARTKGELIFHHHGLTGARGEAENGFATVRQYGLPQWNAALQRGLSEKEALLLMLLALMANNPDTNVVSRSGMRGLRYVQRYARRILKIRNLTGERLMRALAAMDRALIARNISPGGSADLLAVGWVLSHFPIR